MDYKELVRELRKRGLISGCTVGHHFGLCDEAAGAIEELLARAEKAERERDAAIEDMRGICYLCANARPYSALSKKAMTCGHRKHYGFKIHGCEHFKWRGLEE